MGVNSLLWMIFIDPVGGDLDVRRRLAEAEAVTVDHVNLSYECTR